MGHCGSRKLLLLLVVTEYVFSGTAEACSWSWGSDQSGSNWGWGWGSDNSGGSSGSSSSGSDSNSGGSSWGWGWSSDVEDTNWGWGSSSGSSGIGSTHHNHTASSNHSSNTGSTSHSHTFPSNHTSNGALTNNNHTAPSNGSTSTSNSHHNHTATLSPRRTIVVSVWKNGFDYQTWVSKHAPFYVNDVVFFKYNNDQTQSKTKHNKNSVYLLPDLRSYKRCDVSRGKKLAARESSSSLGGFKLRLRTTQLYYFASGDHNDCNNCNLKFSVSPIPRPSPH